MDEAYDLVIVGSGAGGFTAAITAKLAGLRPLLIEKTDLLGGSSAMSGGIQWLPNNPVMKRAGISDSREAALEYLANFVGAQDAYSTPARRAAYVDNVGPMVEMLESQGMKYLTCRVYPDYFDTLPGGCIGRSVEAELFDANRLGAWKAKLRPPLSPLPIRTSESPKLKRFGVTMDGKAMMAALAVRTLKARLSGQTLYGSGGSLQGRLLEIALKLGVDIWTGAPLVGFDVAAGKVQGVQIERDGKPMTIRASRGVIVTAGGFAHNDRMRQAWQAQPATDKWTFSNPGDTGEAIEAMAGTGAHLAVMDGAWWVPRWPREGGDDGIVISEVAEPHAILVDEKGQRFVNEADNYVALGRAMYERNKTVKAIPAWAIFDAAHRRRYLFGQVFPGRLPADWVQKGWARQNDTLAGLAAKCGIDPAGLEATVARFNGFCAKGKDDDFGRGESAFNRHWGDPTAANPNLGPLSKPPYWAVQLVPGDVGTCGGVVTDAHARVQRADGSVIEGLYAAGNCAAPLAGPHYVGAGLSIGASGVFGYAAARHAAG
jgi:3-oxosteroid 1-dehydrogenase